MIKASGAFLVLGVLFFSARSHALTLRFRPGEGACERGVQPYCHEQCRDYGAQVYYCEASCLTQICGIQPAPQDDPYLTSLQQERDNLQQQIAALEASGAGDEFTLVFLAVLKERVDALNGMIARENCLRGGGQC